MKIVILGANVKVKVSAKMLKTLKGLNDVETANVLRTNVKTLSPRIAKIMAK